MLESYIHERLKEKQILLMTHIVIGYPTIEDSMKIIESMVKAGVDIMELQIPFSEPVADGPVILRANQKALANGIRIADCMKLAGEASQAFDIPFLFMSYYNILFKFGVQKFVDNAADNGIRGAIVPDLPPEEAGEYHSAMASRELSPVYIFSPTTSQSRMKYIHSCARGFIYCVARKGVTGKETEFSGTLGNYLQDCRNSTTLPLAVGFGVKDKTDVDFLKGKADIAVIGTQTIRLMDEHGPDAAGDFIRSLR